LIQRNAGHLIVWLAIGTLFGHAYLKLKKLSSVIVGIITVLAVTYFSVRVAWEGFDNEKSEKADEPEHAPPKKSDPHVDLGTTILHAYRNLTPEQIGGMRRDTKELMGLQKELMGTLAEMKPAIEQGAQLLGTFSQFFGSGE